MASSVLALDRELRRRSLVEDKPTSPTMSWKQQQQPQQPQPHKRRSGRSDESGNPVKKRKTAKQSDGVDCFRLAEGMNPSALFMGPPQDAKTVIRHTTVTDKDSNDNKVVPPLSHAALFLAFGPGSQIGANYSVDVATDCDIRPAIREPAFVTTFAGTSLDRNTAIASNENALISAGLNINLMTKDRDTHSDDISLPVLSTPEQASMYSGSSQITAHTECASSTNVGCKQPIELSNRTDSVITALALQQFGTSGMLISPGQQSTAGLKEGFSAAFGLSADVTSGGGLLLVPDVDKVTQKKTEDGAVQTTRATMFGCYQPWVIQTYGDLAKTKTITLRKAARIVRTLLGADRNCAETSKFRFWVRAKGFRLGRPPGYLPRPADGISGTQTLDPDDREQPLYVPTASVKESQEWKKVAVVENFFDIIYCVHVEIEGRQGKHAGQKRTYRTITDTYAFLPREAVTKFLLGCLDCQRHPRSLSPSSKTRQTRTVSPNDQANSSTTTPTTTDKQSQLKTVASKHNHAKSGAIRSCKMVTAKGCSDVASTSPPQPATNGTLTPNESPDGVATSETAQQNKHQKNKTEVSVKKSSLKSCRIPGKSHKKIKNNINDTELRSDVSTTTHKVTITNTDSESIKVIITNSKKSVKGNKTAQNSKESDAPPNSDTDIKATNGSLENGDVQAESPNNKPNRSTSTPSKRRGSNQRNIQRDSKLLESGDVDFSLPITTTYLKHMRSLGYTDEDALKIDLEENLQLKSENDSIDDEHFSGRNGDSLRMGDGDMSGDEVSALWAGYHHMKKPDAQNESLQETSSLHDETSSSGNKEDEDDDDDEADEKMDSHQYDSERLKAFNMFVRLFVDENLDRIVPISKQPKEKIQAIIDSCTRQFPEFAERARKRIRTYLKSCRRNKRSSQPWEQPTPTRPTPAHLTSVAAEQILAQACENESHNAKRMRLGLEPVAQPLPPSLQQQQQQQQQERQQERQLQERPQPQMVPERREEVPSYPELKPVVHNNNNSLSVEQLLKTNGSTAPTALYRPNFSQAFQRAGPGTFAGPPQALFHQQATFNPAALLPGAPTDLSMKQKPLLNHKLNGAEMAAVRQLITGYRESAAFLLRSADELEQLLLQQQ